MAQIKENREDCDLQLPRERLHPVVVIDRLKNQHFPNIPQYHSFLLIPSSKTCSSTLILSLGWWQDNGHTIRSLGITIDFTLFLILCSGLVPSSCESISLIPLESPFPWFRNPQYQRELHVKLLLSYYTIVITQCKIHAI